MGSETSRWRPDWQTVLGPISPAELQTILAIYPYIGVGFVRSDWGGLYEVTADVRPEGSPAKQSKIIFLERRPSQGYLREAFLHFKEHPDFRNEDVWKEGDWIKEHPRVGIWLAANGRDSVVIGISPSGQYYLLVVCGNRKGLSDSVLKKAWCTLSEM